jgi:hypothetical protein
MKRSDEGRPQANAKNAFGFAYTVSAQDFAPRDPIEIVLDGDTLGTTGKAFIESCAG